jgi:hypothetical protein
VTPSDLAAELSAAPSIWRVTIGPALTQMRLIEDRGGRRG